MAYESLSDLRTEIRDIVDDYRYTAAKTDALINRGLKEISARVLMPDLETETAVIVGVGTITASTISFASSGSVVTDSGSALLSSGFHAGETIAISGTTNTANTQTTTVSSVSSGGGTMVVAGTLVTESAGASVTITATAINNIPLPTDFQRNLFRCYSSTHNIEVKVYANKAMLFREFSKIDNNGRVIGVAQYGQSKMVLQRIPSSIENLNIHYYKQPTTLSVDTDTPTFLPEPLVRPLLVNYAIKEIMFQKEKPPKDESVFYNQLFENAMQQLVDYVGPIAKEPVLVKDVLNLDSFVN